MVITKANTVQETDKIECKEKTTTFKLLSGPQRSFKGVLFRILK